MRVSGRIIGAWLVLALCGVSPLAALSAEREPATGGLLAAPGVDPAAPDVDPAAPVLPPATAEAPVPAAPEAEPAIVVPEPAAPPPAAPARRQADDTSWGVLARGGYFGLPDVIAETLFRQHPKVSGSTYGGEIRYHGEGGGRGGASIGLAVDACEAEGTGIWQTDESDAPAAAGGTIKMIAVTVTGYWSLFPSWYVHPYFGLGIGAGFLEGTWQNSTDRTEVTTVIPVIHIPVGLAFELGKRLQLSLEGRFIDGFTAGGSLQLRF